MTITLFHSHNDFHDIHSFWLEETPRQNCGFSPEVQLALTGLLQAVAGTGKYFVSAHTVSAFTKEHSRLLTAVKAVLGLDLSFVAGTQAASFVALTDRPVPPKRVWLLQSQATAEALVIKLIGNDWELNPTRLSLLEAAFHGALRHLVPGGYLLTPDRIEITNPDLLKERYFPFSLVAWVADQIQWSFWQEDAEQKYPKVVPLPVKLG